MSAEMGTYVYAVRLQQPDGTEKTGSFTTRRKRGVGDLINLPPGLEGSERFQTKGCIWRVAGVEPYDEPLIEACLVLDYVGRHPETAG